MMRPDGGYQPDVEPVELEKLNIPGHRHRKYSMVTEQFEKARDEGRFRRYYIREQDLVAILNWGNEAAGTRLSVRQRTLPKDALVDRVGYDYSFRGLVAIMVHPSFDPVLTGAEIPIAGHDDTVLVITKESLV